MTTEPNGTAADHLKYGGITEADHAAILEGRAADRIADLRWALKRVFHKAELVTRTPQQRCDDIKKIARKAYLGK